MTTPIAGAPEWAASQASPWLTVNKALRMIEALGGRALVESRSTYSPPAACADGARYLVPANPGGLWDTDAADNKLAIAVGANAANGWYYVAIAVEGFEVWVRDENLGLRHNGSSWIAADRIQEMFDVDESALQDGYVLKWDASNGVFYGAPDATGAAAATPFEMVIAVSDETTDLTTGTAKITFRMPCAVNLTEVRASVTTAPTGAAIQADINEEGVSILSTKLTIDAGEKTSEDAATPPVISDGALADNAEMTVDIDQIGSSVAGAGLKITLIGTRA